MMEQDLHKHLEYASGYLDLKMYEDAVREADEVLAADPNHMQAIAIKAAIYWQTNQLQQAEPYVAALAERNPKEAGIWVNLAYIRRRTRSLDAAAETLQRALEADPRDALAHFNLACYRAVQHRVPEALALLKDAFQLDPRLKKLAPAEEDFKTLRDLPEFQEMM